MFKDLEPYSEKLAKNKEVYLKVKVSPRAVKTGFLGKRSDGRLKIGLKSVPEKGLANKELLNFLASELGIRKYQVLIVSGAGSSDKLIKITR